MIRAAVLALLSLASIAASAADGAGNFAVDGIATQTCQQFVDERAAKSNHYFMFGGWVDGYVTAINQFAPNTYDLTPWESTDLLMALLDRHCRQNPDNNFIAVVAAMVERLNEDRLQQQSPLVEARVGDILVLLYQDTMMRLQQALARLGHYTGTIDGQFGPQSKAAIESFQAANKIEVTGIPDQLTLLALLRPGPAPQ
jgi:hypothetical protein